MNGSEKKYVRNRWETKKKKKKAKKKPDDYNGRVVVLSALCVATI